VTPMNEAAKLLDRIVEILLDKYESNGLEADE
jgi:hypothetical protein